MPITRMIKNASWVVYWNDALDQHQYMRDCDIVFEGGVIKYIGKDFPGEAHSVIDGTGLMALPGMISLHTHPWAELPGKGYYEDMDLMERFVSKSPDVIFPIDASIDGLVAATKIGICELLKSGCTTFSDLGTPFQRGDYEDWGDRWLDVMGNSGIRSYLCPMARSARWYTEDGLTMAWDWNEERGLEEMRRGLEIIDAAIQSGNPLLNGMVGVAQIDTGTETLFKLSHKAAMERGIPIQTHASQGLFEVEELLRRTGKTPIEWLKHIGVLESNMILGHAVYTELHPLSRHLVQRDTDLIAESGATVAHCPRTFLKFGDALRSFSQYKKKGINLGLGTDTFPLNIISEMRFALYVSRVVDNLSNAPCTGDVFHAATIGGARALLRNDIGRLCPGAKADIVLVDLQTPEMRPCRDPLRNLVHSADGQVVRDVYVEGEPAVLNGQVVKIDQSKALSELEDAQREAAERVPQIHCNGRSADQMSPLSLAEYCEAQ